MEELMSFQEFLESKIYRTQIQVDVPDLSLDESQDVLGYVYNDHYYIEQIGNQWVLTIENMIYRDRLENLEKILYEFYLESES